MADIFYDEPKSWDRTQIPLPFSRVEFCIGKPIYFDDRGNCRKPVYGKLLRHGRWVGAAEQLQQQP